MMVSYDENDTVVTENTNNEVTRSPSPLSSTPSNSTISETTSTYSNSNILKRKNIDNDDGEVIEAKIKTRSQTKALCDHKKDSTSSTNNTLQNLAPNFNSNKIPNNEIKSIEDEEIDEDEEDNYRTLDISKVFTDFCNDQATEAWLNTFKDWNDKNKLCALEQILEICEHSHIKHVHNFIEPKLQRDYISELPKELVLLLLTYVRPKDLYKLAQVSHYWHLIANDNILWKNICKRNRIDLDNLNNNTSMILNEFKENNFGKDSKKESVKEDDNTKKINQAGTDETNTNNNPNESDNENLAETENTTLETHTNDVKPSTSNSTTTTASAGYCSPSSSLSSEPTTSKLTISKQTLDNVSTSNAHPTSSKSNSSKLHKLNKDKTSSRQLTGSSSSSKKLKKNSGSKSLKHSSQPIKSVISTSFPYFNNTISKRTLLSCAALLKLVKTPLNQFLENFNPYKRAYLVDYNLARNWCQRALPKPFILRSHDDHVITCLKFDGFRVVSGSDDCTLKVWCALTGKLLHTLVGHTGGVWASQLKDNIVISGSTDRSVRVWNIDTGECIHVLTGHTSTVRCLALHSNIVISGSRDSLLRVWNIETGQCLQILRGHVAAVRCVCFDGKYVVSGSYDFTIRVWNPFENKCLHVLEGHSNRVYSLLFEGDRIVSGSLDTTIIVWNVHTGSIIHKLIGHHSLTSGMQIKGDILVSGNADSTVKIWSLKTGECMHTLAGNNKHMSAVTCLSFNEKFVVSSSDDGTVKLWNVETGEFIRNLLGLDSGGRGGVVWRISMHKNKLVCAVGSRIGVEETKLILLDFDWPPLDLSEKIEETPVIKIEENLELNNLLNAPIQQIQNV